jgi:KaiC/GvpD/RAD55 family RecA-like ATPase
MVKRRNMTENKSGGSAAAGGMDYQHRVSAWAAALILAEQDSVVPWNLGTGNIFESLRCETEQPVDDLFVETLAQGRIFGQVKHTLELSTRDYSDLASALDQFVRQFLTCRDKTDGMRPLDLLQDRLVLVTSSQSSKPIRVHLPSVLNRLRDLPKSTGFSQATTNADERHVFDVIKNHIARAWHAATGTEPTTDEFREILSLIHVEILDVDQGGTGEREIKNLLRTTVLRDPKQTDLAWSQLIAQSAVFAARRSGTDRAGLQQKLQAVGIHLNVPRDYRNDIQRLKEYSAISIDALSQHSRLHVGSIQIEIERKSTQVLKQAAKPGSLLVVGEPGAGKSGALHEFVMGLDADGQEYIFIAVDHLAAHSSGELRTEMGLEHELLNVLDNWPGIQPAFLVIDALDAARGNLPEKMIRDLMRSVNNRKNRWHVVASIRKFDLRYSGELQSLFAGLPHTEFCDGEFNNVHHLNIPRLSEDELGQVGAKSPQLQALINLAPTKLLELLHVPYNLRLLAELLSTGISPTQLTSIKTQLDLLERYWLERVIRSDGLGDARETVLRSACKNMVLARELRISREDVASSENSTILNDLLSIQVLVEWQQSSAALPDRYTLAFSHHVLFDYAVARLLLRSNWEPISQQLTNDPEMIIVVRPSIVWHFQFLWTRDKEHQQFWELVFQIMQVDTIPEVGKLIGPSVAAKSADSLADLELLCSSLEQKDGKISNVAEQAIRHLIGSLLADTPTDARLIGTNAGPWSHLIERISRSLRPSLAYIVRGLLLQLCERPEELSTEQRNLTGRSARQLFEFVWSHEPRDGWLIIHSAQCVCRTFESDPVASARLIRRCLEPSHISQYGFDEMPRLAEEFKRLIPLDAQLVEDAYRAVFGNQDKSNEETSIGQSLILPLRSNRRQDYQMALFQLERIFEEFVEHAPQNATRALIAAMESYITQHHSPSSGKWKEVTFDLNGHKAYLRTDHSSIWDDGDAYRADEAIKMLDTFYGYLERLGNQQENIQKLRSLVQTIIHENRCGVFWRRLLILGAQFPNSVGWDILPLAWTTPILIDYDTTFPVGEFLRAIFPLCGYDDRERIEQTILTIPNEFAYDRREAGEHIRDRLLGCLSVSDLVTDDAKYLLSELIARHVVPPNDSAVSIGGVTWQSYGEKEFLGENGVPVDAEPNRKIQELERDVKEFADRHLNSVPTRMEVAAVLPHIKKLHDTLLDGDRLGVHQVQQDYAWGYLVAACGRIARLEDFSCEDSDDKFVIDLLLRAGNHPIPAPSPEQDEQFDEFPSWGSPSPRIEAAEGLIVAMRHPTCVTSDALEAIDHLLSDPVPAVRYQIASRLNIMYDTRRDAMWRMIEQTCKEEMSRGVLHGLLGGPFNRIAGSSPDRVATLTKIIFDRIREGKGAERVREFCVSIFVNLYIWRDTNLCREISLEIASSPMTHSKDALHLLGHLRKPLTHGPTDPPVASDDAVRKRALNLLSQLLSSACEEFHHIQEIHTNTIFDDWPLVDQGTIRSLAQLIDHASTELYFASGAYHRMKQNSDSAEQLTLEQMNRFYHDAGAVLDELANIGLASVTYHLMETLEAFVLLDPRGVFLRIGQVIRAGQKGGYQYESLAADLMVRLIERYLAEYRSLLQQDSQCRQILIEILDIFVRAGWPSARRLTYNLEDIFR